MCSWDQRRTRTRSSSAASAKTSRMRWAGVQVVGVEKPHGTRLQERPAVVRGISGTPLRVDSQPWFAVGAQDVVRMKIAVDDRVWLGTAQLANGRDRCIDHGARHRVRQLRRVPAQVVLPVLRLVP